MPKPNLTITIEGITGTGKSALADCIARHLLDELGLTVRFDNLDHMQRTCAESKRIVKTTDPHITIIEKNVARI